jgi:hypothetical protein
VFAVLGLTLWWMRRKGMAGIRGLRVEARSLEPVERLPLTPQHALHLIRVRGREMVVATHPQGCALLLETSDGTRQ